MPTPTSALRGLSEKRQREPSHPAPSSKPLTQEATVTGPGWVCAICPTNDRDPPLFPSFTAALNHERTAHDRKCLAMDNDREAKRTDETRLAGNHLQTANEACWDKADHPPLTSEGLRQWEMHAHVDHVFDLVPFWQRGMDAAEKGEVLRLEEFLEKMEGDGGWRTANEALEMLGGWKMNPSEQAAGWGHPYRDDWAASQRGQWESNALDWARSQRGGWGAASTRAASDATESSHGRDSGWGNREERANGARMGRGNAGAAQDGWGARARVKMARAVRGDGRREELRNFVDSIARQEAATEERRKQMHLFFEVCARSRTGELDHEQHADASRAKDPEDTGNDTGPPYTRLNRFFVDRIPQCCS